MQQHDAALAQLQAKVVIMQQQYQGTQEQLCEASTQHRQLHQQHSSLQDEYSSLQHRYSQLQQQYLACQSKQSVKAQTSSRQESLPLQSVKSIKQAKQLSLQADSSSPVQQTQAVVPQQYVISYQSTPFWPSDGDTGPAQSTQPVRNTSDQDIADPPAAQGAAERLAVSTASVQALTALSLSELHNLEHTCQSILSNVTAASRSKAVSEMSRLLCHSEQLERLAEDRRVCPLCMEADRDTVLNCGHQACQACCAALTQCPFCSVLITAQTHVFQ